MVQELRQKAALAPKDQIVLMVAAPEAVKNVLMKHEAVLRKDVGAKAVEYGRSAKFSAEEETKMDNEPLWIGLRKI